MKNTEDIIKFSWQQIDELAEKLVNVVKASGFKPDYLVGITVGGLVPLALLARGLDINNVITVSANSYDGKQQKALSIIRKQGSKYVVMAESGRKMGEYRTKKEAERRLQQIEFFKHLRKKK